MVRRLPPLLCVICSVALPAQAEDFTGAYAGVNAGYGWSREGNHGTAPATLPGATATVPSAPSLPPSATAAAAALRHSGRSTAGR
ncbi:hypothetical protein [Methylobacterium sp. J-076]|uniref:hypothetical protein n=1 Tax=Methylobacterium sp. J-076 TaxID=2836655 RepID=UPI001FB9F586|nr:hypothetical protein [Methylobacterium sp. J-076]MCJ2012357.1 hypothetical protein [Methylobacterium sp. J-076]